MSEKATTTTETQEIVKQDADYTKLISSFNKHFGEFATVSRVTDDKEKKLLSEQCKAEFENEVNKWQKEREYDICGPAQALNTILMLREWNKNHVAWRGNQYIGVVKFEEAIKKLEEEYKEGEDLILDFGALSWLYTSLQTVAGIGLESALWWKDNETKADDCLTITEVKNAVTNHMAEVARADKKIQILQQVWLMAESGLRLDFKFDINDYEKMLDFFSLVTSTPEYAEEAEGKEEVEEAPAESTNA